MQNISTKVFVVSLLSSQHRLSVVLYHRHVRGLVCHSRAGCAVDVRVAGLYPYPERDHVSVDVERGAERGQLVHHARLDQCCQLAVVLDQVLTNPNPGLIHVVVYPCDLALVCLSPSFLYWTASGWLYAFEYNAAGEQTGYYFFTRRLDLFAGALDMVAAFGWMYQVTLTLPY